MSCERFFQFAGKDAYSQSVHEVSTTQDFEQGVDIARDVAVGCLERGDFAAGMQYGGMVATTKGIADVRKAELSKFLGQRHGNLPGPRDIAAALFGIHF